MKITKLIRIIIFFKLPRQSFGVDKESMDLGKIETFLLLAARNQSKQLTYLKKFFSISLIKIARGAHWAESLHHPGGETL